MPNSDGKVHYSSLKQMEQSPAHYRWATTHERADSTAMRQGRALHALYLQGIEPVMLTSKRKPTDHADHLAPAEYDTVRRMFEALQADSHAKEILSRCPEREIAIEWGLMGMRCAGRVDLRGRGILADLKSCRAAHPKKFLWDAERAHYDAQLPWYDVGGGIVPIGPDTEWSEQYNIAVENVEPYNVVVYRFDPLRIDQGWAKCVRWMEQLEHCLKTGVWPGYLEGIQVWDGEILFGESADEEEEE